MEGNLRRLKESVQEREALNGLFVLVYEDSDFLPLQYLKEASMAFESPIAYHDSIADMVDAVSESTFSSERYIHAFIGDDVELEEAEASAMASSESAFFIICKKAVVPESVPVYTFKKPLGWQLSDYVRSKCKGLSKDDANELCDACGNDPFVIESESDKLSLFGETMQREALSSLLADIEAREMDDAKPFQLVNAVLRREPDSVKKALSEYKNGKGKTDGYWFCASLLGAFKDMASIQMDQNASPSKLKMNEKRFASLSRLRGRYQSKTLVDVVLMLSEFDWLIKSGAMDLRDDDLVDYAVCSVMAMEV